MTVRIIDRHTVAKYMGSYRYKSYENVANMIYNSESLRQVVCDIFKNTGYDRNESSRRVIEKFKQLGVIKTPEGSNISYSSLRIAIPNMVSKF